MWSRRGWGRVCASAMLTAGLPAVFAQSRPATSAAAPVTRNTLGRVVMAVENRSSFCYLPLTIADRLGYFAAEGLDVQLRDFTEPGQALQAMLSGATHLVSGPYSHTISLQMRGQSIRSIVLQGRTPQIVLGVSLQTMEHYRQLRDLRGRRIAVTALGSASHRIARLLLTRAGLGPQDVAYQAFPSASAAVAAFRSGQVDAICYTDPLITQLEQAGELRVVADTRTTRGNADVFGGPLPAGCLSAMAGFVENNPKHCQAITDAMVHALKWLQTAGPSDLIRIVPEAYFLGDRALYLAAFSRARESWTPDGLMPEAGPQTTVRMLAHFDDAQMLQRVNLDRTFTNEFAQKSKARFRA
ncbi:MAG: ABC transporter substrate-binding protein [Betaproteobacteria bacterium HGW-Betaproteobacteria-9]|nr:ABC transporter substrate-binding protein [Hydrogenophaga sp.]PKO32858.1 MAG: ABC transporter substrate-binding protein [Betaproteobacteria bacterium HGW-Betaproteobacteria-9]